MLPRRKSSGGRKLYAARWAGPEKDFRAAMNRIQTLLIERGAIELHSEQGRRTTVHATRAT